jgi:hypothetical protein
VDAPAWLTAGDTVQSFHAEGVFAQRERTLVADTPASSAVGQQ